MHRLACLAAVLAGLVLAAAPHSGSARQVYTGNDLIKNCSDAVICRTYLSGLLDADETLAGWGTLQPQFCPPAPQLSDAIWPVVRAFFEGHTDQLKFTAGSVTLIALGNAYRCPPGTATAQRSLVRYFSAAELNAVCLNVSMCEAFVIGVMDAHTSLVDWKRMRPMICLPETAENRDLMLAVADYVGGHPNELGYTAGSVVLLALTARYPCK